MFSGQPQALRVSPYDLQVNCGGISNSARRTPQAYRNVCTSTSFTRRYLLSARHGCHSRQPLRSAREVNDDSSVYRGGRSPEVSACGP